MGPKPVVFMEYGKGQIVENIHFYEPYLNGSWNTKKERQKEN
jgi:hypothetical protein